MLPAFDVWHAILWRPQVHHPLHVCCMQQLVTKKFQYCNKKKYIVSISGTVLNITHVGAQYRSIEYFGHSLMVSSIQQFPTLVYLGLHTSIQVCK